jgi:hypothetical protein
MWSPSTQAAIAAAESAAATLSNKRKKTCLTPTQTAGPTYAEMSSSEFSDRVLDTPPRLSSRRCLSFAPAVSALRRERDIGNDLLEELKKEVQQLNNDLALSKQETEKAQQQAATATVYVGNVDAHLARAAYTVQSFKTLLEQEQAKTTRIIEQTTLTAWAKQIEINEKEKCLQDLKENCAKDFSVEKNELEKTHMREIENLHVTHRQTVFAMINSRQSEIAIVNETHLQRLEELTRNHVAEKTALLHATNALRDTHANDWTTFSIEKAHEIQDLTATATDKEHQLKQELDALRKGMQSDHRRHLKDQTTLRKDIDLAKITVDKSNYMSIGQYLNKYDSGRGKWKKMAYKIFEHTHLQPALIEHVKHHLKHCVYTCESLARVMDLKHGINLSGINAIRMIEPVCKPKKGYSRRHRNSVLWSAGSIQNCMGDVENEMKSEIGWTVISEKHNGKLVDGIKFDHGKLFTYLIEKFHLGEIAKTSSVEMAITVDGATLDDHVHHVTLGFKICDARACDPVTGELLFDQSKADGEEGNLQSASWCFPVICIIAKDDKNTYEKYFREIFEFCQKLRTESFNGWQPFRISEPQDMKSTQIVLNRGGAAKVKQDFCHLCYCTSTQLALPNQVPCKKCREVVGTIPLCHHHCVCDGDCIAKAELKLSQLESSVDNKRLIAACKRAGCVTKAGVLQWDQFYESLPFCLVSHDNKPSVYDRDPNTTVRYDAQLKRTLLQLGLLPASRLKDIPAKKQMAVTAMKTICKFSWCSDVINFKNLGSNAMGSLEDSIPCVLHLHKRVVEKIIEILFIHSINNNGNDTDSGRLRHAKKLEFWVNTIAFGNEEEPGSYVLPMNKDGNVGDIKFNDAWAKKIEKSLAELLPKMLANNPESIHTWYSCMSKLSSIFKDLSRRKDFTDTQIDQLEIKIDKWSKQWVLLIFCEKIPRAAHYQVSAWFRTQSRGINPCNINLIRCILEGN